MFALNRQSCKWWRPKSIPNLVHPQRCDHGDFDFSAGIGSYRISKTMINHPRFHHVYRWYKPPFPVMCGLPPCFNHINIIIYVVSTVVTIILLFSYYYAASVFSSDYDWNCDRDFFVTKDEPGHRWNPWLSHVYWLNFRYVPSKTVHIKL